MAVLGKTTLVKWRSTRQILAGDTVHDAACVMSIALTRSQMKAGMSNSQFVPSPSSGGEWQRKETGCLGPSSSRRGGIVGLTSVRALFITIRDGHRQHHSIDFSL